MAQKAFGRVPVILLLLSVPAGAGEIEAAGVLGNSGCAGCQLVLNTGDSGGASGVFVDADLTVWASGGDCINRTTFDGKLIERFGLIPRGSRVDSWTFAALDGSLYFFGHLPKVDPRTRSNAALWALPMRPGSLARVCRLFPEIHPHSTGVLAPQTLGGRLVVAGPNQKGKKIAVSLLDPAAKQLQRLFAVPAVSIRGLAVDRSRKVVYVGGYFGKTVGAKPGAPGRHRVHEVATIDFAGKVLGRSAAISNILAPFVGNVSLAGGALWDGSFYGMLARLDLHGRADPGKVTSWRQELYHVTQVVGLRDVLGQQLLPPERLGRQYDPLLIASYDPSVTVYYARWNRREKTVELVHRIGSLPVINSLSLSPDGWISVGKPKVQFWWRWDDGPASPPRSASLYGAISQGIFRNGRLTAILRRRAGNAERTMPATFMRAPGEPNARCLRDTHGLLPFRTPAGFGVAIEHRTVRSGTQERTIEVATAYATDRRTRTLWCSSMTARGLAWWPQSKNWQTVAVRGSLAEPGDLCILDEGRIAIADRGAIAVLEPEGKGFVVSRCLREWGQRTDQRFARSIRLAGEGMTVVVADTDRHRVLWLDWQAGKVLAQFGETDVSGSDLNHLCRPTCIAISGNRVAVADTGNQRVLKLRLPSQ